MVPTPKPKVITGVKTNVGSLPVFIYLAHRHLEKAQPTGVADGDARTYQVPVDLLRIPIPGELVDGIEEVTLIYEKKEEAK